MARRWLSILKASYIVTTLQPHFASSPGGS